MTQRAVGPSVLSNKEFLTQLCRTKSERKRRRMISNASTEQLLAVAEVALNVLKGRLPLTNTQRERLIPYANFVRRLSRVRSAAGARRVIQIGGGPFLVSLIAPILLEIGRALINGS